MQALVVHEPGGPGALRGSEREILEARAGSIARLEAKEGQSLLIHGVRAPEAFAARSTPAHEKRRSGGA